MKLIQTVVVSSIITISSIGMSALPGEDGIHPEIEPQPTIVVNLTNCIVSERESGDVAICSEKDVKKVLADLPVNTDSMGNPINDDGFSTGDLLHNKMKRADLPVNTDSMGNPINDDGLSTGDLLHNK